MRTREKNYKDYGISEEEKDRLMELARQEENAALVRVSTEESNQGLSDVLFISLTTGKGYGGIEKKTYIPAKEDDFYAYRRRALYIFKLLLKGREAEKGCLSGGGRDE